MLLFYQFFEQYPREDERRVDMLYFLSKKGLLECITEFNKGQEDPVNKIKLGPNANYFLYGKRVIGGKPSPRCVGFLESDSRKNKAFREFMKDPGKKPYLLPD
jgi:hypothetical protein